VGIGNGQILFSIFILLVVYATLEFLGRFKAIIDGIHTISYFKISLRADLSLVNDWRMNCGQFVRGKSA
jgi:hypothetical protein